MLNKEINKSIGYENDRRIWNSLVIVLVILDLVSVYWGKDMISIFWDYWKSEKWLRIYMVYASFTFVILVQSSEVKVSIIWTHITRAGAIWLWFHCYSMTVILSALRTKKGYFSNSYFLFSEKELVAPHGSDSLWPCILPYPQWGLLQGGLYVHTLCEEVKSKMRKIVLRNVICSDFQELSTASCWGRAEQRWALFVLSGPWLCPPNSGLKPFHQNKTDVDSSPLTLHGFRVWLRCPFEQWCPIKIW